MLLLVLSIPAGLALYGAAGVRKVETTYPPIGDFVQVDGIRLHYVDQGSGSTIVLLHGANASLRDFHASILPLLTENHRVIAFDRPGYGYSERPSGPWPDPARQAALVHGALAQLDVRQPIIVGHSWSGSLVLAYLLAYPEEVTGGVLLAGGSHPWKGGVAWYNHLAGVPVLGTLFASTLVYPVGKLGLAEAVAEVFAPNPVPPDYIERTGVELALRPKAFLASTEDVRELSDFLAKQSRHYGQIRKPLLLITGDADTVVPAWNHTDRLVEQIPQAQRAVLKATGHAPHHTHVEQISQLISTFAERNQK